MTAFEGAGRVLANDGLAATANAIGVVHLHPLLGEKIGLHAFRRFRAMWLRKRRAPEDLIRFWLGHANKTVKDAYAKVSEDLAYRKEVTEAVGTGFVVPIVPKIAVESAEGAVV